MDQRSVCLFFDKQSLSDSVIHENLVVVLGSNTIASSSVTRYFTRVLWTPDKEKRPISGCADVFGQAIRTALDEQPFSSMRNIARRMCIPTTAMWSRVTNSIGFTVKHIRRAPDKLNDAQHAVRAQMSNELLAILLLAEDKAWQYFVTLDESWFY
jgi:hypothetical protein